MFALKLATFPAICVAELNVLPIYYIWFPCVCSPSPKPGPTARL
jgi:hypothetical protein